MKTKLIYTFLFALLIFIQTGYSNILNNNQKINGIPCVQDNSDLSDVVRKAFEDMKIPGAIIGIWTGDEQLLLMSPGVSDITTDKPLTPDDKMRIGSITKTFTGTVLLQLAGEGKIKLSDKLSQYFPDYPNGDNITIEMLGNMKSGLFNYTEDEEFVKNMMADLTKAYTPEELIEISLKHEPYFPPGTSMHYSNTNTILLGLIIEKLTGNSLESEIQNRILTPLEMKNTSFAVDSYFPEPHGHGYLLADSLSGMLKDVTILNPSWGWAAGAMISDLNDIKKYAKKLATGELITKDMQEQRITWGISAVSESIPWKGMLMGYGFAISYFGGAIGHNGGIPGYNSFMGYIPKWDMTIIIFANMQDNKDEIGPADYIAGKIIQYVMSE
ncbi:MAG TPA: serine hydrolase domain-containing protein [Ignavibacteria bacterium]|mgnify:CR=1 FL=1|nr:serine hydrolase domain-containing protein [Ignavibacteria bacterium]HMR40479.1 serine hydrolase domain-containing protein [Ignavibacteria bacterium]